MNGKLLFLGTGSSTGVPCIGCSCSVCRSSDSHNKRLRPSVLIEVNNKILLIDACPDFREQALKYNITHIDGLLLTHIHFDHVGGIDDLRTFYFKNKKPMPTLLSKNTMKDLKKRFYYFFRPKKNKDSICAQLDFHVLKKDFGEIVFQTVKINYYSYYQGSTKVNGFRIGNMAYVTDVKQYDRRLIENLKGIEILIISALREDPSPVNFNIDEAKKFIEKVGAKNVFLTHLAHEVDYEKISKILPKNVHLAFDGLTIGFIYE
jgi:phosphoribosyl 1,2-cyclic phosphate phosphodiesterase